MDMTALRRSVIANGTPFKDYTATGNPLTFNTNTAKRLKSLSVSWTPTQEGSGDPSPSNVRAISGISSLNMWRNDSVNQWDEQWENGSYIASNGNKSSSGQGSGQIRSKGFISCKPNTEYFVCNASDFSNIRILFYTEEKVFISAPSSSKNYVVTSPANAYYMTFYTGSGYGDIYNHDISINYPATDTDYHAHNPFMPVIFPAVGKNLLTCTPYGGVFFNVETGTDFAKTTTHATYTESGNEITVTTDSNWYGCVFATGMLPPGTYNIHTETSDANCRFSAYITDADLIAKERKAITANNITITLEESARISVIITNSSTGSVVATNIQVESGSSYTAYETYTNTCYGGNLDLTTGVLTVEWKNAVIKDLTWIYANAGYFYTNVTDHKQPPTSGGLGLLCSAIPYGGTKSASAFEDGYMYDNAYSKSIYVKDTSCADIDALKTKYGNYSIAYPLETPITYQLTPQQIRALLGDNTIWSDTNGTNTAVYVKKG